MEQNWTYTIPFLVYNSGVSDEISTFRNVVTGDFFSRKATFSFSALPVASTKMVCEESRFV